MNVLKCCDYLNFVTAISIQSYIYVIAYNLALWILTCTLQKSWKAVELIQLNAQCCKNHDIISIILLGLNIMNISKGSSWLIEIEQNIGKNYYKYYVTRWLLLEANEGFNWRLYAKYHTYTCCYQREDNFWKVKVGLLSATWV